MAAPVPPRARLLANRRRARDHPTAWGRRPGLPPRGLPEIHSRFLPLQIPIHLQLSCAQIDSIFLSRQIAPEGSIDGQNTTTIVSAAKLFFPSKREDRAKLDIVFPCRRGPFIEYRQTTVQLSVP